MKCKGTAIFSIILLVFAFPVLSGQESVLENERYRITYTYPDHSIRLLEKSSGSSVVFQPIFYVIRNGSKPSLGMGNIGQNFNIRTVQWSGNGSVFTSNAGSFTLMQPEGALGNNAGISITYPDNANYTFSVFLTLPAGNEEPKLDISLQPVNSDAWFSVGYYGAPAYSIDEVTEIFQPLPWTEKRFPSAPYLTPAYLASLPATLTTKDEVTYGVIADPSALPFDPLPCQLSLSPFGVAIRDKEARVRPMVWAPIIGNDDSRISAGDTYAFTYRIYASKRDLSSAHEDIARRLYGFTDYRHNDLGSLNTAFENMVDFAMGPYGRYISSMKGYSYETDVPGSVKNTSAITSYSIAYVTDNEEIFTERSVPLMEFMLSRENYLYAGETSSGAGQTSNNVLGDPCMTVAEFMSWHHASDAKTGALLELAEGGIINWTNMAHERILRQNIAFYNATGEDSYRMKMLSGANQYIDERINVMQTDFEYINHSTSSFWSSLGPKFWELFEVYQATGYEKYLEAARIAARRYAYYIWLAPAIPDQLVLCNKGNVAPNYRSGTPISIPEEYAPAWRLSAIGLHTEAGATSINKHQGIFMANHAPYFLRIGALTNDKFLMDLAKAAIIGRWTSFPGYHINTARTTVYEKPDFAHRSIAELLTTTSMHYSHVWPMIALTFDYLVSDVAARSAGAVDFPDEFLENTANLYNNVYLGDGIFYGDTGVALWMPKGLVQCDEKELNYVVARGNGKLYMAFTNQGSNAVSANVGIDDHRLSLNGNTMKIWKQNVVSGSSSVAQNSFTIEVEPHGITAVVIDDVEVETAFQQMVRFNSDKNNWIDLKEDLPEADARTMILNLSDSITWVYAFSDALKGTYSNVTYTTWFDGEQQDQLTDDSYPFEYTRFIPRSVMQVKLMIDAGSKSGEVIFTRDYSVTGTMSGWTSVKKNQQVPLRFTLNGDIPWEIQYSDGKDTHTISDIEANEYIEMVQPQTTTHYTFISATDGDGQVADIEHNSLKVSVIDAFDFQNKRFAEKDAYTYLLGPDNNYGDDEVLKIRGLEGMVKEAYLQFDLSEISRDGEKYLAGIWLNGNINTTLLLGIRGGYAELDEDLLTWNNSPDLADSPYIDTIGISEISPEGNLYFFDVTDFIKNAVDDLVTFQIRSLLEENPTEIQFASIQDADKSKHPCLISDANLGSTGVLSQNTSNMRVYPVPATETVFVECAEHVKVVSVSDIYGRIVRRVYDQVQIPVGDLEAGRYLLIIETVDSKHLTNLIISR
ncbi:MAG: DNRLRE domain-containing protein [Bacteroidales bacterium]|nr:DNRLRE domain-containing protein [Bacteroidales bacterium]MDT8430712.1 DNRLRE domain-containing protein [Bacteroidales bacterium]